MFEGDSGSSVGKVGMECKEKNIVLRSNDCSCLCSEMACGVCR